jgi:AcrR family transcriptional regulator
MPKVSKQRVRRSKAEQRAESIELILDAAEYLFSVNGLHGVTLRDVAKHVGIHTTLVHYYFDDKQNLFEAVFARRAGVTSDLRMAALEKYEADAAEKPTVEGALHAFLDTDLDLYRESGENWMNYAAFCARVSNTPEGAALMDVYFDPVVLKLVSILKRALPTYSDEDIFWGYHFVTGALMNTLARTGRIDRLSGGLCHSDDFPAVKLRIAKFMAAGFHALRAPAAVAPALPARSSAAGKTVRKATAAARTPAARGKVAAPATVATRAPSKRKPQR